MFDSSAVPPAAATLRDKNAQRRKRGTISPFTNFFDSAFFPLTALKRRETDVSNSDKESSKRKK